MAIPHPRTATFVRRSLAAVLPAMLIAAAGLLRPTAEAAEKPPTDKQLAFFKDQVRPILKARCVRCHGGEKKLRGELRLTTRAGLLAGGESGDVVDLKQPANSALVEAINYEELEMPPTGKLPQKEIDILTRWVKMGAPWTPDDPPIEPPPFVDPRDPERAKHFWSFQPVKRPATPKVKNTSWVTNPIDAFILHRLEQAKLSPAKPVGRAALLRRAYYDLTGLPPTPAAVKAFLADKSPGAYEKIVDRLLRSPHYGERWGRHWLDLVHYAESNSFERDNPKPEVWRYRDYVIRSLNEDKPYDQFLREQLAGDELDEVTPDGIIATGYYRLGLWDDESSDAQQTRFDELDDWVATTSQVFLGLTMNCARCHDHKIDPFSQEEYYGLLALLHGVRSFQNNGRKGFSRGNYLMTLSSVLTESERRKIDESVKKFDEQGKELAAQIAAIEAKAGSKLTGGAKDDFSYPSNRLSLLEEYVGRIISREELAQYRQLKAQLEKLERARSLRQAKALCAKGTRNPPETFIMIRGSAHAPGAKVTPGVPKILGGPPLVLTEPKPNARSSGRRRALADWLAHKDNPLTARVIVNRIWQHHFGRGIVRSPSNFGFAGDAPTHPQLLDWLASEFVAGGWRLKAMHKRIMTSSAYRMSAADHSAARASDPENNLFWRFNMRRLSAEEIRDSVLAVSGRLNLKRGGKSIYPMIPREVLAGQSQPGRNWRTSPEREQARRSVYVHIKRSLILPEFERFDFADTDSSCPVRFVTTQPTQALGMLNGQFINRQAKYFAARLSGEIAGSTRDQVQRALRLALQRQPQQAEIERGVKLIGDLKKEGADETTALEFFCLMVLNLNEFVYVE